VQSKVVIKLSYMFHATKPQLTARYNC